MKRHILGFSIFSLIVGATVLIWSIFFPTENIDYALLSDSQNHTPKKATSCFTKRRMNLTDFPVVKQASLDLDTKTIDWQIYVPQTGKPIALHLFAKNSDGEVHLVATEKVPQIRSNNFFNYTAKYMALDNFEPNENLYVVPEVVSDEDVNTMYFDPKFDEKLAFPVTVYSSKRIY